MLIYVLGNDIYFKFFLPREEETQILSWITISVHLFMSASRELTVHTDQLQHDDRVLHRQHYEIRELQSLKYALSKATTDEYTEI
jgi:hypothetical protein